MGRVLKSNSTAKNPYETREYNGPTWQIRIHRIAVQFSNTSVGQVMMMQFGKLLWTLEKTATWISNGKTDEKRAKEPDSLIRPLPWVLFLPTLVALRFIHVTLSLVAISFGFDEIEVSTMVSFLHEQRRNVRHALIEAKRNKYRTTLIDYVKQIALSILSNLRNMILPQMPNKTTNKTSLNASVINENDNENDDDTSTISAGSDFEESLYQDFLKKQIETSDSEDEDFVYDHNVDDFSETDSQSSVASDELIAEDDTDQKLVKNSIVGEAESKNTNGNTADNESNYSGDTGTIVVEQSKQDSHDAKTSTEKDDPTDRLIDDVVAASDDKGDSHNRSGGSGKNAHRPHKNGRNHTKNQNNGKHFNGAQAKSKTKTESTADFLADATADRT